MLVSGSDAGASALRGCASSDSATFRAAYLRGARHFRGDYLVTLRSVEDTKARSATGFDIPAAWLSAGAAAIVATLNDEHMVQLPFAALTTVLP